MKIENIETLKKLLSNKEGLEKRLEDINHHLDSYSKGNAVHVIVKSNYKRDTGFKFDKQNYNSMLIFLREEVLSIKHQILLIEKEIEKL